MSSNNKSARNISLFVGLISLCALFVSLYQARIMRQQNSVQMEALKAQLWPRLAIGIDRNYSRGIQTDYDILVINKGSGPAIINQVMVTHDGVEATDWWDVFDKSAMPDSIGRNINTAQLAGNVLRPGESIRILGLSDNTPLMHAYAPLSVDTDVSICYASVFGDVWQLSREGLQSDEPSTTEKIDDCPHLESVWTQ